MDVSLRLCELREGLTVSYIGNDQDILNWGQPPVVGTLRSGHPGRVQETYDGHHVVVAWFGLEDADISRVVGFSTDASGDFYPGLSLIEEEEYERRVERLRTG